MAHSGGTKYITYLRVSTQRQGISGLGLEAQRASVQAFLSPGDQVLAEYVEIESGRKNNRPKLQAALDAARKEGATLLIAKLDRLARNVAFIANLLEAGVEIAAVDLPQANRFVLHIMAAVGEQEAKAISERTKAALQAAKARGTKLGWANTGRTDRIEAQRASMAARQDKAAAFALRHGPRIAERRVAGASLQSIADEFNRQDIAPPRGAKWWPSTVRSVLMRYNQQSGLAAE
jgi:DNA invertase Pin-like site-specific DNA recombinase